MWALTLSKKIPLLRSIFLSGDFEQVGVQAPTNEIHLTSGKEVYILSLSFTEQSVHFASLNQARRPDCKLHF